MCLVVEWLGTSRRAPGLEDSTSAASAHLLKKHGPLPIGRAVRLVCQLLEALEYAHAKKFVHRDIKPSNLLVAQVEGREVAKLADLNPEDFIAAHPSIGDDVQSVLGVPNAVQAFQTIGSTAPAQAERQLVEWKNRLASQ